MTERLASIIDQGTNKKVLKETRTVTYPNGDKIETVVSREQAPSWQALAWWFERMYPERFAKDRVIENKNIKDEAELMIAEINKLVTFEGGTIEQ